MPPRAPAIALLAGRRKRTTSAGQRNKWLLLQLELIGPLQWRKMRHGHQVAEQLHECLEGCVFGVLPRTHYVTVQSTATTSIDSRAGVSELYR